ncbi:FAD-binding oxidoreductase [Cohnella yongneupensis]|uniref:FAD-binding protein n=1 Tax=Cohnella yongneupensis TaxID=425006 RepID=A0ABW0QXK0_9BACL
MNGAKKQKMSGWGRYPVQESYVVRPENYDQLRESASSLSLKSYLAYGMGRSYGDSPLNKDGGLIITTKLNHFISFDEQTLTLECEAGVSFEEILDVFLPKGYFLPVTPGTKFITVGGAIANDVHGKNHHIDGAFSQHLLDFTLLLASGEVLRCSRDENVELFWATIGGIGLTGIILTAKFYLIPIETAYYDVHYQQARNLDEALRLFNESDDQYRYSVAWIDCLAKGSSLGRSVLMRGNHANLATVKKRDPLQILHKTKLSIPIDFPSFILNKLTIKSFNSLYYNIHPKDSHKIVGYDSFFYPLDSIHQWNRMYGKKGFVQYQAVFPPETSHQGLTEMLECLSSSNRASFLAVLKSSGAESGGLLSFPKKGYTLALDIPINNDAIFSFLYSLDEIVIRHGGRVYLAKDSTLAPEHFAAMYPSLERFKQIKNRVDPDHVFSSSMARRLRIVEG